MKPHFKSYCFLREAYHIYPQIPFYSQSNFDLTFQHIHLSLRAIYDQTLAFHVILTKFDYFIIIFRYHLSTEQYLLIALDYFPIIVLFAY